LFCRERVRLSASEVCVVNNRSRSPEETGENRDARDRKVSETLTAWVSRDSAGNPLGATLFLPPDDLTVLGIDPETVDEVDYRVEDGRIRLTDGDETEGLE
jgi:hypothetical protein